MNPRRSVVAVVFAASNSFAGEVLWDNGDPILYGISHLSGEGQRRSVLDDFEVSARGWSVSGFLLRGSAQGDVWGDVMTLELSFYRDAAGTPDFDDLIGVAGNVEITETRDPDAPHVFGLEPVIVVAEFDALELLPGRYWVDMHIVNPLNWFQWVPERIRGNPIWVDYEDFGGRQPGRDVFGADYDVNFIIQGESVPSPGGAFILLIVLSAGGTRRRCRREKTV